MANDVDAVVTEPLNEAAMHTAGFSYSRHTELREDRTEAERASTPLFSAALRAIHISTDIIALNEAILRIARRLVLAVIETVQQVCHDLDIQRPRIAVAGLNLRAN